ncbi:3-methyladenine DNA glycosylase AlkC [Acinetobacter marinus]|uniref:3-methyladenine DNA glycosylase AlkC n=1 Tax=Acinetobacter marinus TaxID=281375 RepID=A0A1G6GM41_9GAMM|nr:DNA alkylation repair protein [Acinetobacter marinus]SDB82903.1 3-methyladenine DNA glycosylase AlkC [Acinetobacter marinus]
MNTIRKGARSTKDIPQSILEQLNRGEIESANLVEWLAVDQIELLKSLLAELGLSAHFSNMQKQIESLKKPTVNSRNACIGSLLYQLSLSANSAKLLSKISTHPSDMVRCWACYAVVLDPEMTLIERFQAIQPFAQDSHFGVREVAWMAMRPYIILQLEQSIEILQRWVQSENAFVRRFATEATRPRGVWCAHIEELKENPEMALSLLEPLSQDPEKYVQDSVANWLNDASKTKPEFVQTLCDQWLQQAQSNPKHVKKATQYIVKRALRTLSKG